MGKVQGAREGGNRSILRWKIAALSTGEVDFETYLITNNIQPKAGQLVRLLSVPFIDTEAFNGLEDGDAHSRAIKRESQLHCGAAGREWIRWLTENKELSIKAVADIENEWLASLPEEASPQVRRVASRFALLDAAGKLAGHITGWEPQECTAAIKRSFSDWLEDYGLGNREKHQVITRARDFIQRFGMSRFQPYTYGKPNGDMDKDHAARINNLAGYLVSGRRDDGRSEYHMIPSVFEKEILCGVQRKTGIPALHEVGMLMRDDGKHLTSKTISINGTQQRFCVLLDVQDVE